MILYINPDGSLIFTGKRYPGDMIYYPSINAVPKRNLSELAMCTLDQFPNGLRDTDGNPIPFYSLPHPDIDGVLLVEGTYHFFKFTMCEGRWGIETIPLQVTLSGDEIRIMRGNMCESQFLPVATGSFWLGGFNVYDPIYQRLSVAYHPVAWDITQYIPWAGVDALVIRVYITDGNVMSVSGGHSVVLIDEYITGDDEGRLVVHDLRL